MIKLLIVDDEAIARINLRHLIDWEKEGFTICGEADNGSEALEKIEELKPEIVFTDMNMPGMNGVEFIRKVKEVTPSIKIVAFSAFEDFEFVRQSLKEGVIDYLVKHKMDTEALISILNTIKENIYEESIENQKMSQMMSMAMSGKAFMKKNILQNLLNDFMQEDFKAVSEKYDIKIAERNLIIAVARIDHYYQLKKKFTFQEFNIFMNTIENIFSKICEEMGKIEHINLENGKFVFIMSFEKIVSEAKLNSEVISNVSSIEDTVKRFLNITMSFGISSPCPSIYKMKNYYDEACKLLETGYYKGENYIVQKNELINNDKHDAVSVTGLSVSDEKKMIAFIRALDKEGTIKVMEEVFKNLKVSKCSFEAVKAVSIDLISIIHRILKESNIAKEMFLDSGSNLYEEIDKIGNLEEIKNWFKLLYTALIDAVKGNSIQYNYSDSVKKAIEYILNHYNRDISLTDVSLYVNISPQYLSKLFKEECGKGFVTYLNSVRIENAKKMIADGCELKSLTQKLGFNNYTYFFTVFKDIVGMTPQQYEKRFMKEKNMLPK